jgi:hypothetical protein
MSCTVGAPLNANYKDFEQRLHWQPRENRPSNVAAVTDEFEGEYH